VGVVVWRDDGHGSVVKGNDDGGGAPIAWCSVKEGGKMEMGLSGGESGRGWDDLFIAAEGGRRVVRRGWSIAVVRIQCFG
jgi:hypothetical protein